jgi:hypothetical protein
MQDSNHLLDNPEALRKELESKGFLLIRGVHDREQVLAARLKVLRHLDELGGKLDPSHPAEEGVLLRQCGATCVPFMEGENDLTKSDEVTAVLTGPRIKAFFRKLFGGEPLTFDYKWCVDHELHLHTLVAEAAPRDACHPSNARCFVKFETRTHTRTHACMHTRTHARTHASTTPSHCLHVTV